LNEKSAKVRPRESICGLFSIERIEYRDTGKCIRVWQDKLGLVDEKAPGNQC